MAIPAYCSSDSVSPQVIYSENPDPSALDSVLSALWSWAKAHPDCSYREFRCAYLRASLIAERWAK